MTLKFEKLAVYRKVEVPAGDVLIEEATISDKLFVLDQGTLEVYRADVSIALVSDPGALFGEMSALLDVPHTASVRAVTPCSIYTIEGARKFLDANPEAALPIARLLAERLQHATAYLVDVKRQFAGRTDHFEMVDEVLEALLNAQPQPFNSPDAVRRGQ